MSFRLVHRYLSLAVLAIWLVQAVTGTLSVFRWEFDDMSVTGRGTSVNWTALGARIDRLDQQLDTQVSSVWTSGTAANRFDVHYSVGDDDRTERVDGSGNPLRDRSNAQRLANGTVWDTITTIHTSLLAGDIGKWIIGISGILLVSNIMLGLKLAWPKAGTWRKTLFAKPAGGRHARLYGWHRKVGLWFAPVALVTISGGVLMAFGDGVEERLGASLPEPTLRAAGTTGSTIGFTTAITAALRALPGSKFAGVSLPDDESPWYRVRVRSRGEVARKWGASVVYVGASNGQVLLKHDAAIASPGRTLIDVLYPVHTGQIGSWLGRLIVLAVGLALIAMIALGAGQWATRRRPKS
jgi:uncharacterized iron-regulated membrane protein